MDINTVASEMKRFADLNPFHPLSFESLGALAKYRRTINVQGFNVIVCLTYTVLSDNRKVYQLSMSPTTLPTKVIHEISTAFFGADGTAISSILGNSRQFVKF